MLEKLIKALKTKRVQGVVVFAIVWILGIFGIGVDETSTIEAYMALIAVLSGVWHIYGWVDAFKGHDDPA